MKQKVAYCLEKSTLFVHFPGGSGELRKEPGVGVCGKGSWGQVTPFSSEKNKKGFLWEDDNNMDKDTERYVCKSYGFSTMGFPQYNEDLNKKIRVNRGDIVQADSEGYLWKDGVCICHKDSIAGHYHFRKN